MEIGDVEIGDHPEIMKFLIETVTIKPNLMENKGKLNVF